MKEYQLGEFEEIVLLTVAILYEDAYGVSIKQEIETRLKRNVSVSALQTALRRTGEERLSKVEFWRSNRYKGRQTQAILQSHKSRKSALDYTKDVRVQLWSAIPNVTFEYARL